MNTVTFSPALTHFAAGTVGPASPKPPQSADRLSFGSLAKLEAAKAEAERGPSAQELRAKAEALKLTCYDQPITGLDLLQAAVDIQMQSLAKNISETAKLDEGAFSRDEWLATLLQFTGSDQDALDQQEERTQRSLLAKIKPSVRRDIQYAQDSMIRIKQRAATLESVWEVESRRLTFPANLQQALPVLLRTVLQVSPYALPSPNWNRRFKQDEQAQVQATIKALNELKLCGDSYYLKPTLRALDVLGMGTMPLSPK